MAELGDDEAFEIRNSASERDFVDVRDVAAALLGLTRAGAGIYNIASGDALSILDMTRQLARVAGRAVVLQPDGRGGDSWSCGDASRLEQTGWVRQHALRESLEQVWREQSRMNDLKTPASSPMPVAL
jgi:nucleoside-diphosphate-sugar epimerase